MRFALSKEKICSFRGDILPLYFDFPLRSQNKLADADIKWSCEGEAVRLKEFSGEDKTNFNNGVLLILKAVGLAKVKALYGGKEYVCEVEVREPKRASSDEELNYYFADMHDHTVYTHNHEECFAREKEFQIDYINQLKEENLMDASVISDHAGVISDTDFFRGFVADEESEPKNVVILPGAESEISFVETDRFGIKRRHSGEIVTLNSEGYVPKKTWEEFENTFQETPAPIGIFAHPTISGFSTPGLWDFDFANHATEEMRRIMRGIELGSGKDQDECLIYEYAYSDALDAGFKVSPTCASDSHGPVWGYYKIPGKTVILAKEKSREAFIDALRNNRFYATETGNVKLRYSVNGKFAPCELAPANKYHFKLQLSYFNEDKSSEISYCRVISDGGVTLKTIELDGSELEFEIESNSARYFYLRLSDSLGRRTWSMPVFTGRSYDKKVNLSLSPIAPEKLSARERLTGKDASALVDGNPHNFWEAGDKNASLIIDIGECREISAIGICQRIVEHNYKPDWKSTDYTAGFPFEIEIYTSLDGLDFKKCKDHCLRAFGSEEIIALDKKKARYVLIEVKSTVGSFSGFKKFADAPVAIGNVALFE